MAKLEYSVVGGIFEQPSGKCFEIGTAEWWDWLESDEARSFRFECDHGVGSYTARKEAIQNKGYFWYAYKKLDKRLHKSYIGKSVELTLEKLEAIADSLGQPKPVRLPTSLGNSKESELPSKLPTSLGNSEESKLPNEVGNSETEELRTRLAELEKESRDLRYRCSDLERENARLERLGTDYSHASFITLQGKYEKALNNAKHWEEVAESYRRQAEAIAKKKEEAEDEVERLEAKLSEAVARIVELEPLQLRISGMEDTMRHMHNELLTRPHPEDLIRRKVSELGMQEKIMQHQRDPKTNARYWALAKLLEALETS
jgi:DNA repair exonuclease SbcCD ATPase subunit